MSLYRRKSPSFAPSQNPRRRHTRHLHTGQGLDRVAEGNARKDFLFCYKISENRCYGNVLEDIERDSRISISSRTSVNNQAMTHLASLFKAYSEDIPFGKSLRFNNKNPTSLTERFSSERQASTAEISISTSTEESKPKGSGKEQRESLSSTRMKPSLDRISRRW